MTGRKIHANLVPKIGALSALTLLPTIGCTREVSLIDPDERRVIEEVPITSCSRGGLCQEMPEVVEKLDLLFVIDNSEGMASAQRALTAQLPTFLEALASGRRLTDENSRFPAARDIQVGVVTSDMGMLSVEQLDGCAADGGDDGRLQTEPRGPACQSGYPPYSRYASESATADIASLAADLACIIPVGTDGCDYVQPLQAALKALTPYVYRLHEDEPNETWFMFPTIDGGGEHGRGDQLGGARGLVREDAMLGIIVLTNDDDTSVKDTEAFKPVTQLPRDSEYREQDAKLRAFLNPESLHPINLYLGGFKLFNLRHRERVVFAAIAGVPADLVAPQTLTGLDYTSERAVGDYYDAVLSDERMTQRVDPATDPGSGEGKLMPSCMQPAPDGSASQPAYPPRRLVELARDFGPNGVVQSICQDDLAPAMGPIVDRLASQLGIACLEQPLQRRADGSVDCEVIWELSEHNYFPKVPSTPPYECSDREFLTPAAKPRNDRTGNNCSVRQLVATDADHLPSGEGFYYDDFTPSPENSCRDGRMTRIRFTPGVIPNGVVRVVLDCSPDAARK